MDVDALGRRAAQAVDRAAQQRFPAPQFEQPSSGRWRRRPRSMALALAAGAAVTAIVVALGLLPGGTPGSPPAASALELAARTAATRPYTEPGPDERWYQRVRMDITTVNEDTTSQTVIREYWTARDGRLWVRDTRPNGRELTPRTSAEARWAFTQSATLSADELRALPTDPAAMRDRMEVLAARQLPKDQKFLPDPVVYLAVACLTDPAVRPAQRAALFRMVARTPGVQTLEATKDGTGRPATAIVLSDDNTIPGRTYREVWMFDPRTTQIIALHSEVFHLDARMQRHLALEQDWIFENVEILPAPKD